MNARTLIGTLVVVNVLLLGVVVSQWKHSPAKPASLPPASVHVTNITPAVVERAIAAVPAQAAAPTASTAGTNTFDWRRVESADYHQYIANLRASGCPEKTIRDIIIADVNEMFRERARSHPASTNRCEYWKPGDPLWNTFSEDAMAKQQQLSREKRDLLKSLLGDNAPTGLEISTLADSCQQRFEQILDFLPADTLAPLMELDEKYSAKLSKARKDARQGDPAAMRKVMAEQDAELLQLLSPEQKFEYELRMSDTAMVMRMLMAEFEPTEQQFRDMFKAQKVFDEEFRLTGVGLGASATAEEHGRREDAEAELDGQFQKILGEDGFRLYTYEKRWERDPLNWIAKVNSIPKETAFKVFDLQKEAQVEAAKVRENQALAAEQRTAALTAMRTETEKAVGQVLGPQTAQAYFKKALWIKNMAK